ncbi:hypothetical protein DFP74_3097 [Nocardiopsis sp. Huas11]|uniref:DUF6507 family protein n=1 Tax=Nocardiopsis sp. Huas11 TaxID=2183912 RepID=UPI000EB4F817|nr:DUF6507 family protein [Nocardiopsis sp. Huas11]RKS07428.1 hypothetical protein DFP74_3097 [Nocardiopsis sp. Huas11]
MSSWDIDPEGVAAVLTAVAGHFGTEGGSGGLIGTASDLERSLNRCAEIPASFPITTALGEWAEHYFGLIGQMAALTASALEGTAAATTAYVEGNGNMAAQTEAAEHQATAGVVPLADHTAPGYSEPLP